MDSCTVLQLGHDEVKQNISYSKRIVELLKISFNADALQKGNELPANEFLDECLSFLEPDDVQWWLLLVDGELVTVANTIPMQREYFLWNLCTHKNHQSNGYAKYLVFEIKARALKQSIIGFKGNVDVENIGAIAFYSKYGAHKDINFSRGDGQNKPTSIRMLLRWDEQNIDDATTEIRQQQESVAQRLRNRKIRSRSLRMMMIAAGLCAAYLLYKKCRHDGYKDRAKCPMNNR